TGRACGVRSGAPGILLAESQPLKQKRNERSGAEVARVERTCHGGIFGAFEDGSPVGKDGHFVGRNTETNQEIILADVFDDWPQAKPESGEVNRAAVFVNLHGISAAQGDVWLRL